MPNLQKIQATEIMRHHAQVFIRRKRVLPFLIALFVAVWGGAYLLPLWLNQKGQDNCVFKGIAGKQYEAYLNKAKNSPPLILETRKGGLDKGYSTLIGDRVAGAIRGQDTFIEKVAAIHALMRSLGGYYRSTVERVYHKGYVFFDGQVKPETTAIEYNYYIDISPKRMYLPIRRWMTVKIVYNLKKNEYHEANTFYVVAFYPHLLSPFYMTAPKSPVGEACPIVPLHSANMKSLENGDA
ncbi:hypothetical protein FHS78_003809 [Parvibaculum indicum]|uniref:hypothetical protein n=1 Tax=Parvibaculum indicum TaxID=562969 RepID=UPI001422384C|nr:hypothetical protein [Parvibaculum indicum]NIJ43494.1 hypothetical protein [Parvibaculum indicum]